MKISNRYVSIVVLATFGLALGVAWVRTRYVGQVVVMDTKASIEPTAEGLSGSKQSAGEVGIRGHSSKSSNPRDLYLGDGISLGDRFDKLASQAGNGNLDAKQFVLQIAASCRSWAGLSEDKRAVAKLKPAAAQALEQLSAQCKSVLSSPAYADQTRILDSNPLDVFDQDVRQVIEKQFAAQGAQSALTASVSALKARPNESTISTINDTLGNLDVATVFTEPMLSSTTAMAPEGRQQLLQYALNLLACDFGRPCGPGSEVVLSYCAGIGVCMSGAGLEQLYESEMLSGEDMRDVYALLDMLRKVRP